MPLDSPKETASERGESDELQPARTVGRGTTSRLGKGTNPVQDKQSQPRWWTLALAGGLGGGLSGILSGPIAMFAFMVLENYLHGATFLGLEVLVAPILGAILGALEGTGLGAIWLWVVKRPRRLTIARLILVVAISGPSLAFFVAFPTFALLVLINALLTLPVAIAVLVAVVRRHEERSRLGWTSTRRTPSNQDGEAFADPGVRFSDWGDPDLLERGTR